MGAASCWPKPPGLLGVRDTRRRDPPALRNSEPTFYEGHHHRVRCANPVWSLAGPGISYSDRGLATGRSADGPEGVLEAGYHGSGAEAGIGFRGTSCCLVANSGTSSRTVERCRFASPTNALRPIGGYHGSRRLRTPVLFRLLLPRMQCLWAGGLWRRHNDLFRWSMLRRLRRPPPLNEVVASGRMLLNRVADLSRFGSILANAGRVLDCRVAQ
jgi:hypothetical protein